ncbi:MAG: Uma2 family endonuclease [Bacteroidota bacterium]
MKEILIETPPRTIMEVYKSLPTGTLAELIDNIIYMSPSPISKHQVILNKINVQLYTHLEKNNLGMVYLAPLDVYLDEKSNAVQPDLSVVLNGGKARVDENGFIQGVPDLIVEILSTGNREYNLVKKKELYQRFGVKEYWVVDPDTKLTQGFQLQKGKYNLISDQTGKMESPLLVANFLF